MLAINSLQIECSHNDTVMLQFIIIIVIASRCFLVCRCNVGCPVLCKLQLLLHGFEGSEVYDGFCLVQIRRLPTNDLRASLYRILGNNDRNAHDQSL